MLGVAVGIYLPLDVSMPILAGGIVAELVDRLASQAQRRQATTEKLKQNGMLYAAGSHHRRGIDRHFHRHVHLDQKDNPDVLTLGISNWPGGKWIAAAMVLIGLLLQGSIAPARRAGLRKHNNFLNPQGAAAVRPPQLTPPQSIVHRRLTAATKGHVCAPTAAFPRFS